MRFQHLHARGIIKSILQGMVKYYWILSQFILYTCNWNLRNDMKYILLSILYANKLHNEQQKAKQLRNSFQG